MSEVMEQVLAEEIASGVEEEIKKSALGEVVSPFDTLNNINVNNHTEKKNGLTYLSWAWAWAKVKQNFPNAQYIIYENADGWNYFTDGRTGWVKTGVVINSQEHIEYLPIMDFKNKSIPLESITSTDVNKAIQRSLTKACARHGLGLYIYAGEDLPEAEQVDIEENLKKKIAEKDVEILRKMLKPNQLEWVLGTCKVDALEDLTNEQFGMIMNSINKRESNGAKGTA